MVSVYIEKENKHLEINVSTGIELLKKLNINPETVLIVKNGELVTSSSSIKKGESVKLLSVISGG